MSVPTQLQASFDAVTKAAALVDATDLPGLVALQEQLLALAEEAATLDCASVSTHGRSAADLVEQIVLRQVKDASDAMRELSRTIESMGRSLGSDESAPSPHATPEPANNAAASIDVPTWLAHCDRAVEDLSALAETADRERSTATSDVATAVRDRADALARASDAAGLPECANVCRSLIGTIDAAKDADRPLPVPSLTTAIDWLRDARASLAIGDDEARTDEPPAQVADGGEVATDERPDDAEPVVITAGPDCEDTLAEFLTEAQEHLASAEAAALALEKTPSDREQINTVFRAFHTIKGVAGFMSLQPIVEVAHAAETLLDKARSGSYQIDRAALDLILASCDMLARMVRQFQGNEPPYKGEKRRLIERLEAAAEGRAQPAASARTVSVSDAMRAAASAAERVGLAAGSETKGSAQGGSERSERRAAASEIQAKPADDRASRAKDDDDQHGDGAADAGSQTPAQGRQQSLRVDQTVKVSTTRMDTLLNMVGELVIAQLMVQQDPLIAGVSEQRVQRNLGQMSKIVRDLQEVAMSLRMVTLKSTFQKMTRLVRDLQARAGKRIQLVVEGDDVELDRNVVEEIADPLVHMVRNACDHGIESEADRIAAGKPPAGTLTLKAFHRGGMIVIEVGDDGRGLQRERILKKCLEKGLIPADRRTDEIPDAEVYNYVFLPGFSTAEKITDISGRGVGMDVVKRNIEALRGKIEIRSTPGAGSTFSMQLPLTMAIIDGMLVRVGGQRYVVPTLAIERSFRPTPEQVHTLLGKGELAMVRGDLLPIRRLNRVFGLDEGVDRICEGLLIVLESGGSRCCLLVDEILGQQQVVIKNLGQDGYRLPGVTGGAILGDGRVALIVDVGGLMQQAALAA
jgi:two-component system chemotaxis sensor kinase CheA